MTSAGLNGIGGAVGSSRNMPAGLIAASDEDTSANVDEPPDECRVAYVTHPDRSSKLLLQFNRSQCCEQCPKQSLLTQALTSDESHDEENLSQPHSNASFSSAELTSDGGPMSLTSRIGTPSPPPPLIKLPCVTPGEELLKPEMLPNEDGNPTRPFLERSKFATETDIGKRRCIKFACTDSTSTEQLNPKPQRSKPVILPPNLPRRNTALTFVCPSKEEDSTASRKANCKNRVASPAPRKCISPPPSSPTSSCRNHRSSDSTTKNDSPKSTRRSTQTQRSRISSTNSDLVRSSAYRFHEFASSEEEVDDWVQELTCHKSRLTVDDTLTVENGLRRLGQEVEEEVLADDEDEEVEEDEEEEGEEEGMEEDDSSEQDDVDSNDNDGEQVSEGGFQTDNEDGFADSDDDERFDDAHSDYEWWAPTRSVRNESTQVNNVSVRLSSLRCASNSSAESFSDPSSMQPYSSKFKKKHSRKSVTKSVNPIAIQQNLPDSTDFVCGTLDEDRPLEDAFKKRLEIKRIESHRTVPQDIDPTFPTSDPELDDEGDEIISKRDEHHQLFHGQIDFNDEKEATSPPYSGNPSSIILSKRLNSPAPMKRSLVPSPPPVRKCGIYSPKRCRSPPPNMRHFRPTASKRQVTDSKSPKKPTIEINTAVTGQSQIIHTSSLPRTPSVMSKRFSMLDVDDNSSSNDEAIDTIEGYSLQNNDRKRRRHRRRGAIDIVKGLERKRQYRKEKLYQKRCREMVNNRDNRDRDRNKHQLISHHDLPLLRPGKGVEKMRELGIELATCGKGRYKNPLLPLEPAQHIISI